MEPDDDRPITLEEADDLAHRLTNGEVSLDAVGETIFVRRIGFTFVFEFPRVDLTPLMVAEYLQHWQEWPEN